MHYPLKEVQQMLNAGPKSGKNFRIPGKNGNNQSLFSKLHSNVVSEVQAPNDQNVVYGDNACI